MGHRPGAAAKRANTGARATTRAGACVIIRLLLLMIACASPILASQTPPASQSAQPSAPVSPCPSKAEYRQFDFWIGEWDVTDHGEKIATSSIQSIVGGCVVFENYSGAGGGYTGKSFNFYDASLGKWRQTWVDAFGNVSEFVGEFRDGAMRYEGETHRAEGRRVLRKMIFTKLDDNRVRQYSERSLDGGKTWGIAYDYIYTRRK